MTSELEILKSVESKENITQRELARRTGLSLGAVNVLIKRLIHKGLIKIEHISTRTIKYMLTPKGLMEKARLTYKYIVTSYNHISDIENKLEQVLCSNATYTNIFLYGEKDELYEIIISKLRAMNKKYEIVGDECLYTLYNMKGNIIITWSPDHVHADSELGQADNVYNILG